MQPLDLSVKLKLDESVTNSPNLCDRFSDADLTQIGNLVLDGYKRDEQSRINWFKRMEAGMDLAMQIQKDKNFPWPGASNVIFPLVTIASLQFSARSYENIIQGTDVVKYRVLGTDLDGQKKQRADRISAHMSWQVLEEDEAWEEQHDRLLINLGIVGTALIKTYFSSKEGHNVSELVMARDFVVDYWAKSVATAARATHIIPLFRNEIYEKVKRKAFRDVLTADWYTGNAQRPETNARQDNRLGVEPPLVDGDTPFRSLEQHRNLDLDGDGYEEPYIVTIEESSAEVLRIVAGWDTEGDIERTESGAVIRIKRTEYFTKYGFIPAADGGFYDTGFGVLLGPLNEAVDSGINQLIDAGTMANSNGGFLGRGAKIRGGVYTFAPWEWKRIDSTGDDIRKSMVPFPVREPSSVMLSLLSLLIEYTDRVAGTVDQAVGKNPGQNTPAETSRNSLEQGMRVYASIFKRVWRSLKQEFKKLHQLNARYLPSSSHFGDQNEEIRREDYLSNPDQVVPVADPNVVSQQMKVQQAVTVREASMQVPGYDREVVERRFLKAMRVEGINEVYPGADKTPPLPNPKAQLEQMKLQAIQMKIDWEKQKFIAELQSSRAKNQAEINKMQAEIYQIISSVQVEQSSHKVEVFERVIDALKTHNDMINDRIAALSGEQDGKPSAGSDGMGSMGNKPADQGSQGVPASQPAATAGAMG